jgi:hypothetical protein
MGMVVELGGVMGHGRVQFGRDVGGDRSFLKAVPGQDGTPRLSRGCGLGVAQPDLQQFLQDVSGQFHRIASLVPG